MSISLRSHVRVGSLPTDVADPEANVGNASALPTRAVIGPETQKGPATRR